MTTVVGFISQKGGVGKSTLARALGVEAAAAGLVVKMADLDTQQGTLINWHRRRLNRGFNTIGSVECFAKTTQALQAIHDDVDLLILDGPARTSRATLEIAQQADLLIQATGTSLDDLEPAVLTFHELIKHQIPRQRLVMAFSRVGTDAELQEAVAYIEEAGYQALAGCLYEKPAYRQAQNEGLAITETRYKTLNSKADALIQSLLNFIN